MDLIYLVALVTSFRSSRAEFLVNNRKRHAPRRALKNKWKIENSQLKY